MGGGFGGSLFFWGEGGKGGRRFVVFVYLLTIPLVGISLLGAFFSPFLFPSGTEVSSYLFSCFLPFSFLFLFRLFYFLTKLRLPPP